MPDKPGALNDKPSRQLVQDRVIRPEEICEALLRLRALGEKLPLVDAVAIIRESRDLAAQGNRGWQS